MRPPGRTDEPPRMTLFRGGLILAWSCLAAYTAVVIANHGLGFAPIFFGDVAAMTWPGQFNFDFACLLSLSALWTAWRNDFRPAGLGLGLLALVGGAGFLLAYLVVLSLQTEGDAVRMLVGDRRAR